MIILDKNRIKDNIEKRIFADINSGRVGGAQVCVKQNGETVYENCFGLAGEGRELTRDTVFRLASMTKPITGAAILLQIGRGLVSLDDPIERFIPEYSEMDIGMLDENNNVVIKGKAVEKVRVLHLLTHTSGVGCAALGDKLIKLTPKEALVDIKSVSEAYGRFPLAFEPYTCQAYSPRVAFDILARIVELTSGMTYDEFLRKEFFEPLDMRDTSFLPSPEQWNRMVSLHNYIDGKAVFYPVDRNHIFGDLPLTYFCGGASLSSTVDDYIKFAEMLLSGGKTAEGKQLLDSSLVDLMRTPAVPDSVMCGDQKWGLSVRVITTDSYKRLPKNAYGWSGAYGTHFWVDPDNKITAVYMKNSNYDGGSGALTAARFEEDVYL